MCDCWTPEQLIEFGIDPMGYGMRPPRRQEEQPLDVLGNRIDALMGEVTRMKTTPITQQMQGQLNYLQRKLTEHIERSSKKIRHDSF
jgi:hypothetical protein